MHQLEKSDNQTALFVRLRTFFVTFGDFVTQLGHEVLRSGVRVRLVEAGNHCQGCIFRDGSHLLSTALRDRIDEISRNIPGFFIGRYDIRYTSDKASRERQV